MLLGCLHSDIPFLPHHVNLPVTSPKPDGVSPQLHSEPPTWNTRPGCTVTLKPKGLSCMPPTSAIRVPLSPPTLLSRHDRTSVLALGPQSLMSSSSPTQRPLLRALSSVTIVSKLGTPPSCHSWFTCLAVPIPVTVRQIITKL